MAALVIVGAIAMACVSTCAIVSSLAQVEMVTRVNERLPAEQRFASAGWHLTKSLRLWAEYRRLYPDGRLLRRSRLAAAVGLGFFLLAVCCFVHAGGTSP